MSPEVTLRKLSLLESIQRALGLVPKYIQALQNWK